MRLNAPDGKLLGKGSMPKPLKGETRSMVSIQLDSERNVKAEEIYFVYIPKSGDDKGPGTVILRNVKFDNN
jgi:hypothetical protein